MGASDKINIKRNKKSGKNLSIDPENIFKELSKKNNDGFTVREISNKIGRSESWVQRNLAKVGAIYVGKKNVKNVIGVIYPVPCYRIENDR